MIWTKSSENLLESTLFILKATKNICEEFFGGPVVRTLIARGLGSIPGRGTKIPQAMRTDQKIIIIIIIFVIHGNRSNIRSLEEVYSNLHG